MIGRPLRPVLAIGLACLSLISPAECRTWVVSQMAAQADDLGVGNEERPFRSIAPAAARAEPGDTVLVHAGVYRERVAPARGGTASAPIEYRAADGESVVIKGSALYTGPLRSDPRFTNVRILPLARVLEKGFNPFGTPLRRLQKGRTLGQVFVDGERYREVDGPETVSRFPGTWCAAADGKRLFVRFAPSSVPEERRAIELSVRSRIFAPFARGLGYIHVIGFVMLHCANQFPDHFWESDSPQAGALGCRGGDHWLIERNVIRFAQSYGVDCGTEGMQDADGLGQPEPTGSGYHIIRGNIISDNGAGGIAASKSLHTVIEGNTFERNNADGHTAPESAAVKTHQFIGGRIEGNLFRDNECYGIWCDNVYVDVRISRNVLINNRDAAIFMEMGGGPALIENNILALTRGESTGWHNGSGFFAHDAGGLTLAHNLIVSNADFGVLVRQEQIRSYAVYPAGTLSWENPPTLHRPCLPENIRVLNNVILDNHRGAVSLPFPGPEAANNTCDGNAYEPGDLSFVPFVLNRPHGDRASGIVDAVLASSESGVPPFKPFLYLRGPMVDLAEWHGQGFDRHGGVGYFSSVNVRAIDLSAVLQIAERPDGFTCTRVDGVGTDFQGRPLAAPILPGPFQDLALGQSIRVLWPVPEASPVQ